MEGQVTNPGLAQGWESSGALAEGAEGLFCCQKLLISARVGLTAQEGSVLPETSPPPIPHLQGQAWPEPGWNQGREQPALLSDVQGCHCTLKTKTPNQSQCHFGNIEEQLLAG